LTIGMAGHYFRILYTHILYTYCLFYMKEGEDLRLYERGTLQPPPDLMPVQGLVAKNGKVRPVQIDDLSIDRLRELADVLLREGGGWRAALRRVPPLQTHALLKSGPKEA
jgi:hypothetical protein